MYDREASELEHYRQQAQMENRKGGGTMKEHSLLSVVDFPKRESMRNEAPGQEEARNVPLSL